MEKLKSFTVGADKEIDELEAKQFEEIKKDFKLLEYLNSIGLNSDKLIKENISHIVYYLKDHSYCKNCPGLLNCDKDNPHYLINLKYDGRFVYDYLSACDLKVEDEKLDNRYITYNADKSLRKICLSDIEMYNSGRKSFRVDCLSILNDKVKWVYIYGGHKTGKTFSSVALLNQLILKNKYRGSIVDFPKTISDLSSYYFKDKEYFKEEMDKLLKVKFLVIDDFGNEYKNEITRDFITLPIFQERSNRGLVTIINSIYDLDQIRDMYAINGVGKAKAYNLISLIESNINKPIDYGRVALH